jgi:hypothetical protein
MARAEVTLRDSIVFATGEVLVHPDDWRDILRELAPGAAALGHVHALWGLPVRKDEP